jgi:hypothetical protein
MNMRRALVVGGPEDFVRGTISRNLQRVGIEVEKHYDYKHLALTRGGIPKNVDLVMILVDMVQSGTAHELRNAARTLGVPTVSTVRKWSVMLSDLVRAGVVYEADLDTPKEDPVSHDNKNAPPAALPPVRVVEKQPVPEPTFEQLIEMLREIAGKMFKSHGVVAVTIDPESGIEIERKLTIREPLASSLGWK